MTPSNSLASRAGSRATSEDTIKLTDAGYAAGMTA